MFADDCCLTCPIPSGELDDAHERINAELDIVSEWLKSNKILINSDKTKYMIYTYRGQYNFNGSIVFGGSRIEKVESVKFLGVIFDDKLRFANHVSLISTKIAKSIGLLYKIRDFVPKFVLNSIYSTLVYPYLSYAIAAWFNSPKYIINSLIILQKKANFCINFLDNRQHTSIYFQNMNLLSLPNIFNFNISLYMFRTLDDSSYDPNLFSKLSTLQDQHRNQYLIPRYKKSKSCSHIHYFCVKFWNEIPIEIANLDSLSKFKRTYKKFLVNKQTD